MWLLIRRIGMNWGSSSFESSCKKFKYKRDCYFHPGSPVPASSVMKIFFLCFFRKGLPWRDVFSVGHSNDSRMYTGGFYEPMDRWTRIILSSNWDLAWIMEWVSLEEEERIGMASQPPFPPNSRTARKHSITHCWDLDSSINPEFLLSSMTALGSPHSTYPACPPSPAPVYSLCHGAAT